MNKEYTLYIYNYWFGEYIKLKTYKTWTWVKKYIYSHIGKFLITSPGNPNIFFQNQLPK